MTHDLSKNSETSVSRLSLNSGKVFKKRDHDSLAGLAVTSKASGDCEKPQTFVLGDVAAAADVGSEGGGVNGSIKQVCFGRITLLA